LNKPDRDVLGSQKEKKSTSKTKCSIGQVKGPKDSHARSNANRF